MHTPRILAGILLRAAVTIAAALGLVALLSNPVLAAGPTVRLTAEQGDGGGWVLTAQVNDAKGNAVGGANVDFDVAVTFVASERNVAIGSAVTDTSGAASIAYRPTWNGRQVLTASVDGGAVSVPAAIDVRDARSVLPPDPPTLGLLRSIAPPIGILVAVGAWLLLFGTFLYAVLGIARRSRPSTQRSMPATVAAAAEAGGER